MSDHEWKNFHTMRHASQCYDAKNSAAKNSTRDLLALPVEPLFISSALGHVFLLRHAARAIQASVRCA